MFTNYGITEIDGVACTDESCHRRPAPFDRQQLEFFGALTAAGGEFAGKTIKIITTKMAEFVSANGVASELED